MACTKPTLEEHFFENRLPKDGFTAIGKAFLETFTAPVHIPSTIRRLSVYEKSVSEHPSEVFCGMFAATYLWWSSFAEAGKSISQGHYLSPILAGGLICYTNYRSWEYEKNLLKSKNQKPLKAD